MNEPRSNKRDRINTDTEIDYYVKKNLAENIRF